MALSEDQRALLRLLLAGDTYERVAEVLGTSAGEVRSVLIGRPTPCGGRRILSCPPTPSNSGSTCSRGEDHNRGQVLRAKMSRCKT